MGGLSSLRMTIAEDECTHLRKVFLQFFSCYRNNVMVLWSGGKNFPAKTRATPEQSFGVALVYFIGFNWASRRVSPLRADKT